MCHDDRDLAEKSWLHSVNSSFEAAAQPDHLDNGALAVLRPEAEILFTFCRGALHYF